jgi:N-acetylglucosaminyl-diphospho-decaprenol L-rhamnosyltransferase
MPHALPLTSIAVIVVNYRTSELALSCLASLDTERKTIPDLRAVIVDGGSDDGSAELLAAGIADRGWENWVELLPLKTNGGFGWANNQAILTLSSRGELPEFIHLLNPDTMIEPGACETMRAALLANPDVGAVGSQLLDEQGHVSASAFRLPSAARQFLQASRTPALGRLFGIAPTVVAPDSPDDVEWVSGASFMVRTEVLRRSGLFDSGFFLYFEEVELFHRIRKLGWKIRSEPKSIVRHIGGAATGVDRANSQDDPPKPEYWFQSRARCLALTLGRSGTILATLSWLAGAFVYFAKSLVTGKIRTHPDWRGLLAYGVWPSPADLRAAPVPLEDAPGTPPEWMTHQ